MSERKAGQKFQSGVSCKLSTWIKGQKVAVSHFDALLQFCFFYLSYRLKIKQDSYGSKCAVEAESKAYEATIRVSIFWLLTLCHTKTW